MFYTYVLYSESFQKTYVGFTSNLEGRLSADNDAKTAVEIAIKQKSLPIYWRGSFYTGG